MEITCPYCELKFFRKSLTRHVSRKHKIFPKELSILIDYDGKCPLCECGCGLNVTFNKGKFKRFYHSHACRDPIIKQKMINGGIEASKDKEKLEKTKIKLRNLWLNKDFREKQIKNRNNNDLEWKKSWYCSMKKVWKNDEYRKKLSIRLKKQWQDKEWSKKQLIKLQSNEFKEKVSKATTIALSSPKIREQLSNSAKNAFIIGRRVPKSNWENIKGEYKINLLTNENEWMDSGWESLFAQQCDLNKIKYLKNGHYKIQYQGIDFKQHTYHPDFFLPERNHIIEIKGRIIENDQLKWKYTNEFCESNDLKFFVLSSVKEVINYFEK